MSTVSDQPTAFVFSLRENELHLQIQGGKEAVFDKQAPDKVAP